MSNETNDMIKLTIDKFILKFPVDLRYSDSGLWIRHEHGTVRIGLSDFAQQRNGDIAFAHFPDPNAVLSAGDEIASIETVKVNISLPSPMAGTVIQVNPLLQDSPEYINQDPYGDGWMVLLQVRDLEPELSKLLTAEQYSNLAKGQAEAELKL